MGKPRKLFTDGWNSFWHFVIGMIAYGTPVVTVPLFRAYQMLRVDKNTPVDLHEFQVGMEAARRVFGGRRRPPRKKKNKRVKHHAFESERRCRPTP